MTRQLTFKLTPDKRWHVIIINSRIDGRELGHRSFQVDRTRADEMRRSLWRLRPDQLAGLLEWSTYPSACPKNPLHVMGETFVSFAKSSFKPDAINRTDIGVTEILDNADCDTPEDR